MAPTFEQMKTFGQAMKSKRQSYENDRQMIEQQWLKNLRQYNRQYDPDVKERLQSDRSQAYPGDTRIKVDGETAKMMEMMFPAQERNWELKVSPNPSIKKKDLEQIIMELEAIEEAMAIQEEREPQTLDSDTIERAVKAFAKERKNAMEEEIADQLADDNIDYVQIMKRAVRSGTIYGCGFVRCPQVRTQEEREFKLNEETGMYEVTKVKQRRPYPEFVRCWDYYPDLSARVWQDMEGGFERIVVNRYDFEQFAKRPDFDATAIKTYLKNNPKGNYTAKNYDTDLAVIADEANTKDRDGRRYEVYRWLGFLSGAELAELGLGLSEEELEGTVFTDVWVIDDTVIKKEKASFGARPSDIYHAYIPAEDEDSGLTGVGLPENVRDSQMNICASTRALNDNMAATCGPILEVNQDLLPGGRKSIGSVHAFMTIEREGDGQVASAPAVRPIFVPSHITELLAVLAMHRQQLDIESNIPAWTMGSPENLGEGFRTSTNMSIMSGGANMVTKDHVRAFDKLTSGVIGAMLKWNMEFNKNEDIKGDFAVQAKGNVSLVAKEVRGAALDQLISTLSPEERVMIDTRGLLEDRFRARDLPTDRLLPPDVAAKNVAQMQQAQQQAEQAEAGLTQAKTAKEQATAEEKIAKAQATGQTTEALIAQMLSQTELNLANAKSPAEKQKLETMKLLLEGVQNVPES